MASSLVVWLARRAPSVQRIAASDLPTLLGTLILAVVTLTQVTGRCAGIALPLDDAYIHFQYAASFAKLNPLVYSEGAAPSAGATSLLWSLLLAPLHVFKASSAIVSWVAVSAGFLALWGLCRETRRLALYFIDATLARWLAWSPLAFAAHTWFAASGMEVMPFAWLLAHTCRKTLEFRARGLRASSEARSLLVLAALCPLMRPEGALLSLWVAAALWRKHDRAAGLQSLIAGACVGLPALVNWSFTGQLTPTTAFAKWLPLDPYRGAHTPQLMWDNLRLLFGTLFDGRGWTPMFLPEGIAPITWASILAVTCCAFRSKTRYPALALLCFACGVILPTSYDTFLVNRLRYLWPFITPWLIGLGIVASWIGGRVSRRFPAQGRISSLALLLLFTGGLAAKLPEAIADLSVSAQAISEQQVWLARWAKGHLAQDTILGVNDAGAAAYFSGHRTFDLVGLTTASEARHWRAGPGSRFEHYERMNRNALPSHFMVYPEWFAVDPLLGRLLTARYFESTILGGPLMQVHEADYSSLGSAANPQMTGTYQIVDELDVADLDSEQRHEYELGQSSFQDNRLLTSDGRVDGGRSGRTLERFQLALAERCAIIVRVQSDGPTRLSLQVGDSAPLTFENPGAAGWSEHPLSPPRELCGKSQSLTVKSQDGTAFLALHYWSIAE